MSDVRVETVRLRLRVPAAVDHATLLEWYADPHVMADLAPEMDAAGAKASLARHDGYREEGLGFWLVERKADGVAVGFCGLKRCNPGTPLAGQLEIGWLFGAVYWGQGYASEAAAACLAWGWARCSEDRIIALTARANAASQRVMARIGMRPAPELDFAHPSFAPGHRLRDTVVYVGDRT